MCEQEGKNPRLVTLAALFVRIGITGFGGALANMALMEQAWMKRYRFLNHEQFLEGVALCYLLPGPTAVLLSIYLGSRVRGSLGGLVSGLSFITPAVVLTFVLSWVYFRYHTIPVVSDLFVGLGPVVVALADSLDLILSLEPLCLRGNPVRISYTSPGLESHHFAAVVRPRGDDALSRVRSYHEQQESCCTHCTLYLHA